MSIVAYDKLVKGKRVTYKSIPLVPICDLLNNNKIGNEGYVFRPRQKVKQCDDCMEQRTHRFPATIRERVDCLIIS